MLENVVTGVLPELRCAPSGLRLHARVCLSVEPGEPNATIDRIDPPCSAGAWAGKCMGAGQSGVGVLRAERRQERDSKRPARAIRRLSTAGRPRGGGMEVL